jgi:hypothetical protein
MKLDFEAAVINAINKVCPDSVLTGCNFHFSQFQWTQIQNIGHDGEIRVQRKLKSLTHLQTVCCFGIPTYQ